MLEKYQKQLNKIFKENQVVLAYLFGSAAKGKMTPLSDIDFAVVFSDKVKSKDNFKKQLNLAHEIGNVFRIDRVDIVNLETAQDSFLKHSAVFEGKLIYNKDNKKQFQTEDKIMKEYEDNRYLMDVQHYYLVKHTREGTFGKGIILQKSKYLEKIKKYVADK